MGLVIGVNCGHVYKAICSIILHTSNLDPYIMQNKLKQAQTELAALKEQTETENIEIATSSHDESVNIAEEKRKTEERLKRLIRRCELYIQRHQMLKEMGTKM